MRARRFTASLFVVGVALGLGAFEARADVPAQSLVRLLKRRGGGHPLADDRGRVPILVPLPIGADAATHGLLEVAPGYGAIRLAPDDVDAYAAAHPGVRLLTGPPRRPLLDRAAQWIELKAYRDASRLERSATKELVRTRGEGVVVGIVDTGVDVTHPDFRHKDGKTRIAWMLQAGEPLGVHETLESRFGCSNPKQTPCAIFSAAEIDEKLARDEPGSLRDRTGHGTHVASIATGNGGPMVTDRPRYVGVAPAATMIVAAPSLPGRGFDDIDILNAVKFIFDRAEAMQMPAVVNLSVGSDFGSHDGTSELEAGLAALIGDSRPGRAIVVAAGNSGTLYQIGDEGPFGIHTEVHASPYAETRVPIRAPKSSDGQGFVWITFRPGDEVSVGLEAPDGDVWIGLTDPGEEAGHESDDGKTTAAVINRLVNGKAPITPETNSAVVAWDGAWNAGEFAILLRGRGDAQLWVTGLGDAAPGADLGLQFARGIKQGTINVPASHPALLAVGCTVNRVRWSPFGIRGQVELTELAGGAAVEDSVCYFSAAGPTPFGVMKPEISAPGAFVAAAMGRDADPRDQRGGLFDGPGCPDDEPCYVVDAHHAIASGSSMAAPQVAGAIALLFQRKPDLTQAQLTRILQAGARYPDGVSRSEIQRYATQLGAGELDLVGALRALQGQDYEDPETDIAVDKSWYVLSSAYARPDPTWPVEGIVELRRSNGAVANRRLEKPLSLSVQGGVVVAPLTEVVHGMWRFAVAATNGSSGETMRVDVLYDGVSLGARELGIGTDVWTTSGPGSPEGGACMCVVPVARKGPFLGELASGLAAALLLARRRLRRENDSGRTMGVCRRGSARTRAVARGSHARQR